jgi:hypothetical protein
MREEGEGGKKVEEGRSKEEGGRKEVEEGKGREEGEKKEGGFFLLHPLKGNLRSTHHRRPPQHLRPELASPLLHPPSLPLRQ